jgi:predicted O-methyltransferase YrrM
MSRTTIGLDEGLRSYLIDHGVRDSDVKRRLREHTAAMPEGGMQISPEQGQLLEVLVKLLGATQLLEVGTFTGYSALCMATALPDDGRIVCCDISAEFTDQAEPFWAEAGVRDRIDLRIGPAADTLDAMLTAGEAGRFDLAFVDADKESYLGYLERCLQLLRPGGALLFDNTLWGGSVADPDDTRPSTATLKALNRQLHVDDRVDLVIIPIGDGLTLCRKR